MEPVNFRLQRFGHDHDDFLVARSATSNADCVQAANILIDRAAAIITEITGCLSPEVASTMARDTPVAAAFDLPAMTRHIEAALSAVGRLS